MSARIVVAYNDSPSARRALEEALRRAAQNPECALVAVAVAKSVAICAEDRRRTCEGWLQTALDYADKHGQRLDIDLRVGHPATELLRAALAHNADLLLVGYGDWETQLGHTAEMVMHHAPCPVLVVR